MLVLKLTTKLINIITTRQLSKLATAETLKKHLKMVPKHREDPLIKKLNSPYFKAIFTEEVKSLASIFKKYNYEIRIAGGAVRDLLMDKHPKDLDFATTATPTEMKEMFTKEGIRMINETGEKHGTITPRINDKENFEVTTLRIDVVTDGRHAEVQYTTDWLLDSNRRDLTINSMFLGLDGSVYDYFYGLDDLEKRRVAFVGDPVSRIQEDYLRILRYFRFYGRICDNPDNHEESTLLAITENAPGLKRISGERLWMELKQILENKYAGEIVKTLLSCKIAPYIGLPENPNMEELKTVWKHSKIHKFHPITLLSSLVSTEQEALNLHGRLKLSAYERDLMFLIVANRGIKLHPKPLHPYKSLIAYSKNKNMKSWVIELLKYLNSPHLSEFEEWVCPKFPIDGAMLKEVGIPHGKKIGIVLGKLRDIWVESEFKTESSVLMAEVPNILETIELKKN